LIVGLDWKSECDEMKNDCDVEVGYYIFVEVAFTDLDSGLNELKALPEGVVAVEDMLKGNKATP